ncbi:12645_t:CDS:10 [Ambispora gerdemannii]|uniref:RNA polymerase II subunit A C-terminal domain phosphatase n=1 Tax=Ambispora gerdemannii TaxID=144530 RepID=A0A9N9ALA4_9GLOM|nr:12645_t:CDS:10 [Ambispora gerdemannii]
MDMEEKPKTYEVKLPQDHLPATITRISAKVGDIVTKNDSLFFHKYIGYLEQEVVVNESSSIVEKQKVAQTYGEFFNSPVEGEVFEILVQPNQQIKDANEVTVIIKLPCPHDILFGGLCALCGQDCTRVQTQRATINMAHDAARLFVSQSEAERLEQETAERLKKARKLSLVVDLDQTIIHATVDPTIEEWMKDENNPNHAATKDIKTFSLPDNPTVFYIKMRPGLEEFLREISEFYELHIYTMGTRHYAEAVANIIDPKKDIFSERILSRDESGSMIHKNIRRLFPCDDSMVVVIDDRADVWQWAPNVIKVNPYGFFVGIGDINASFMPKQNTSSSPPSPEISNNTEKSSTQEVITNNHEEHSETSNSSAAVKSDSSQDKENENASKSQQESGDETKVRNETKDQDITRIKQQSIQPEDENIQLQQQEQEIKKQVHDRPLAQLEQQLTHNREKPVLIDDDVELSKLLTILKNIHKVYYDDLESNRPADATKIIPAMKSFVLQGVKLVFTHVIPTKQPKESSDIWNLALSFGAQCFETISDEITHLVAGERGTDKIKEALSRGNIQIVRTEWLIESIKNWERQPEEPYLLEQSSANSSPKEDYEPKISAEEVQQHFLEIDWDSFEKEVDDEILESGDTSADSDLESGNESGLYYQGGEGYTDGGEFADEDSGDDELKNNSAEL